MERAVVVYVVVVERVSVFELAAAEHQTHLVGRGALLVVKLGLERLDRRVVFDIERQGVCR